MKETGKRPIKRGTYQGSSATMLRPWATSLNENVHLADSVNSNSRGICTTIQPTTSGEVLDESTHGANTQIPDEFKSTSPIHISARQRLPYTPDISSLSQLGQYQNVLQATRLSRWQCCMKSSSDDQQLSRFSVKSINGARRASWFGRTLQVGRLACGAHGQKVKYIREASLWERKGEKEAVVCCKA